jgi:DNA-binding response OmpR family regulator
MMVGDKARILVVDDDDSMCRSLAAILTREGHEVIQAAGGAEACRICREENVDLAIVDLFMPDKDGIETIMELRALARGMPIIAMSGGGADAARLDLLNAAELLGAGLSLEKPFTPAEMLEAVRKALRGGTQGPT